MDSAPTELVSFLREAKLATYAAQGDEATVAPAWPNTKQLEYQHGDWSYRDVYAGLTRFVGQEWVYAGDRPIWSMSYAGGLTATEASGAAKTVYAFLRVALSEAPFELPLRGPPLLERAGLVYACECQGGVEWFRGSETITRAGVQLYSLQFAGGLIV